MRHDVQLAHLCRRWRKRGMTCPFAPHAGEDDDEERPEDESIPVPVPLGVPARRRLKDVVREMADELKVPESEAVAEAVGRVLDQGKPAAVPGLAEEAVADTVRDRVFSLPDLPELPAVPVAGRSPARGFAGGGFFFNATQRLFGLMQTFPRLTGGGGAGGGEPGGGTGMGGGARG